MSVVKRGNSFFVVGKNGKELGGPFRSRKQAVNRLQQVESFKHKAKRVS